MSREWRPGDVAVIADRSGFEEIGLCYQGGVTDNGTGPETARWRTLGPDLWSTVADARPLVVIDPEDREQVERLRMTVGGMRGALAINRTEEMQAALREFASPTPERPDEPTGLGAVVEDEDGRLWVRTFSDGDYTGWRAADFAGRYRSWDSIAAVKVLSEGVTE